MGLLGVLLTAARDMLGWHDVMRKHTSGAMFADV